MTSPHEDSLAMAQLLASRVPLDPSALQQATVLAFIDIAQSLRSIADNNVLIDIKGELHNIQRYGIGK